jgi:hypothetical protein
VRLELRGRNQLGVLVTSREGMSRGAALSRDALERVLAHLEALIPDAALTYRSDRDGPLKPLATSR